MIRDYQASDYIQVSELFYQTIHAVNRMDYTPEELQAWAPVIDHQRWKVRLKKTKPIIAEKQGIVVGFAELEADGHIDCFYVHKDYQRQGVGKSLIHEIFNRANRLEIQRLFSEVSITAKPFFEAQGFRVIRPNLVHKNGLTLKNYIMERHLNTHENPQL